LTRPYDLDEHIRRTLERERSPRVRTTDPQLSLFDTTGFVDEWLVERPRRLETESGLVVCEDDMLFARAIFTRQTRRFSLAPTPK
jgi:hypothetical protein